MGSTSIRGPRANAMRPTWLRASTEWISSRSSARNAGGGVTMVAVLIVGSPDRKFPRPAARRDLARPPPSPRPARCLLDDERRHHAEHAALRLGVAQDVAVEGPGAGVAAAHQHVPALAGGHVQRVALP